MIREIFQFQAITAKTCPQQFSLQAQFIMSGT